LVASSPKGRLRNFQIFASSDARHDLVASLVPAIDPVGATKPNSSTHAIALKQNWLMPLASPLGARILNLIDLEPRVALAGALSWKTMAKIEDILMFCCVSGFLAGIVIAVTTLPG
jgi:hypothetical protein